MESKILTQTWAGELGQGLEAFLGVFVRLGWVMGIGMDLVGCEIRSLRSWN